MGKRKRSDSESYSEVLKQMRRLEKKIKRCRRRIPSSDVIETEESRSSSTRSDNIPSIEDLSPLECNTDTLPELVANQDSEMEQPPDSEQPIDLNDEVLEILGEDPTKENVYGENLHKDITPRWTHILKNGLPKDTKAELIKKYKVPENCSAMKAPKLNLEIKAALTELNLKKEVYNETKQNQLSSCLAALGLALNIALSSSSTISQDILKLLSDAGRLLCDFHYRETQSRRYAIINTLNKQVRDTVKDTKVDEFLFGTDLAEHLKSSKAISKSGTELKPSRAPFKPTATQPQRGALNARGASRAAATDSRATTMAQRTAAAPTATRSRQRRDTRASYHSDRQRTRRR